MIAQQMSRDLLGQGLSASEVARLTGLRRDRVVALRNGALICTRCAEGLRQPSPDDLCGFCRGETGQGCPECGEQPSVNGGRCWDCRGRSMQ